MYELVHLKTFPVPDTLHVTSAFGSVEPRIIQPLAEEHLPSVLELDSRFSKLNEAYDRAIGQFRAGNDAEGRALLVALEPLGREAIAAGGDLVEELNTGMLRWVSQFDGASHAGLMVNLALILLAVAIAFPLGYVFAQVVVRPVTAVGLGMERIGSSEFSTRVEVDNRDKLGELAGRVNQMSAESDRLYGELRDLNENLEQKVQEQLQVIERATSLKRYLSPQLADSIIAGQSDVKLQTTRKYLTVCFSDIRGFTGLSERMEPEELVELLNSYFTAMTEIVFRHGGTLDKYLGDGMLVFFGDPIAYDDHAERAVKMAVEMRDSLTDLQKQWFADGHESLNIGVGIVTGYVAVGNIGSPARLDYTVVGDNANLASRLGDMAAPGQILITDRTMAAVREVAEVNEVGEATVKGSTRPVNLYEVLSVDVNGGT